MNILPKDKDKRTKFILVIAGTLGVLGLIGFCLIRPQYESLDRIAGNYSEKKAELEQIKTSIKSSDATATTLEDVSYQLLQAEGDLASGDVYAWTFDTIRKFKAGYHVDIPSIGQPQTGEMDMMPQFPYRQIKVNVSGIAYYHDLGKFVSDFENNFPHMRIVNLAVEPGNLPGAADTEKLSFRMDVVALVKAGS